MHEQYCYKGKKILIIILKKTSAIINHTAVKKSFKKSLQYEQCYRTNVYVYMFESPCLTTKLRKIKTSALIML